MNILKRVKLSNTKENAYYSNENFILGKDETLEPKFTRIFGLNYSVNVYYLKISKPELNLEKNCINIHLPMKYRKQNNQALLNVILFKMYTKIAENELENIMEKARHTFGFAPEDYNIKKLDGTLAQSNKDSQSITINPQIVMYSKEIIEYVVFHEFCHLKYKNHTKQFYNMLKKYKPNYENISKQIPNLKY
jgi:hypothetical protein